MPRISEYTAPEKPLRADEKGFSAFETAGRRVGPEYREAATDVATTGRLNAQIAKDAAAWPFDLLQLLGALRGIQQPQAGARGVSFRVKGGIPDMRGELVPGPTSGPLGDPQAWGEMSNGAAAGTRITRALLGRTSDSRVIDVTRGVNPEDYGAFGPQTRSMVNTGDYSGPAPAYPGTDPFGGFFNPSNEIVPGQVATYGADKAISYTGWQSPENPTPSDTGPGWFSSTIDSIAGFFTGGAGGNPEASE